MVMLFGWIAACFLTASCWISQTHASPNYISDRRIRDPDMSPVLGRGFSMSSYAIVSTCLTFTEKTQPTYNYEYDYHDIDESGSVSTASEGSLSSSIGYFWVKSSVSGSHKSTQDTKTSSRHIVTTMKMERYYSSLDDSTAELTSGAASLLSKGDTVGFFQACGSGYIRTIRRTAEVVAIFTLKSSSTNALSETAASVTASFGGWWGGSGSASSSASSSTTTTSSSVEVSINIRAFGMGLNLNGSDSFVARNMDDYFSAMKFAFKSMQNDEVGLVQGIEIVTWANTLQFQNALNFREGMEQLIVVRLKQEGLLTAARLKLAQENELQRLKDVNTVENDISTRKKTLQEKLNKAKSILKTATDGNVKPKKEVGDANDDLSSKRKISQNAKDNLDKMEKDARDIIQQAENLKDAVADADQKGQTLFSQLTDIIDKYKDIEVDIVGNDGKTVPKQKYSSTIIVGDKTKGEIDKQSIIIYAKAYAASSTATYCTKSTDAAENEKCDANNTDLKTRMQNLAVDYETALRIVDSRNKQLTDFGNSAVKDTLCRDNDADCLQLIKIPEFSGVENYCMAQYDDNTSSLKTLPPATPTTTPASGPPPGTVVAGTAASTMKEILNKIKSTTPSKDILPLMKKDKFSGICLTQAASILADRDLVSAQTDIQTKKDELEKQQQTVNAKKKDVDSVQAELVELENERTARLHQSSAENFLGLSSKETTQMDGFALQVDDIEAAVTQYTYKGIATGITLSTMALKDMATINAEFIAFFEDKYRAQTYNLLNGFQCNSMLELYISQGLKERKVTDRKRMKMNVGELMDSSLSVTVSTLYNYLNRKRLLSKMKQIQYIMHDFYGPCISALNAAGSNGVFTRYYFELQACDVEEYYKIVDKHAPEKMAELDFDAIIEMYCLPELLPK